ncbi:BET1 [Branchiostoma lanceolatum]|uniref:BET1 protein n=1 Tax=Branchiostoma lanceolatum TaxID=7740 RepID=A0A8K0AA59_BRALA|nr:BET1 [Branchiostoma lanceolatum]
MTSAAFTEKEEEEKEEKEEKEKKLERNIPSRTKGATLASLTISNIVIRFRDTLTVNYDSASSDASEERVVQDHNELIDSSIILWQLRLVVSDLINKLSNKGVAAKEVKRDEVRQKITHHIEGYEAPSDAPTAMTDLVFLEIQRRLFNTGNPVPNSIPHWKTSAETSFSTGKLVLKETQHWNTAIQHWETSAELSSALENASAELSSALENAKGRRSTDEMLEQENQSAAEQLAGKVSTLKSLALDIEDETRAQNQYLGGMGGDMESVTALLGGSSKRFKDMLSQGKTNRKVMLYLAILLVVIFIIVYFTLTHVRQG